MAAATYEHPWANAAIVYLTATDRTSVRADAVEADGISLWATPKLTHGFEALLRYDRLTTQASTDSRKTRVITGLAWWPTMPASSVTSAFMLDLEQVRYTDFTPARPTERRIAVHMLVNF